MTDTQPTTIVPGTTFDPNSDVTGGRLQVQAMFIGQGGLGFVRNSGVMPTGSKNIGTIVLPLTSNRPPTDADFYNPVDGMVCYDVITCKLYIRTQGNWPSVGLA